MVDPRQTEMEETRVPRGAVKRLAYADRLVLVEDAVRLLLELRHDSEPEGEMRDTLLSILARFFEAQKERR